MSKSFRRYEKNVFVLNGKALKIQHWFFKILAEQNKNQAKSKTPSQQKSMKSPQHNNYINSIEKQQDERLIKSQPKTQKPSLKGIKIEQNSIKYGHNQNHVTKGLRIKTPRQDVNGFANGNHNQRSVPQSALNKNEKGLKPYSLKNVHSQSEINSAASIKYMKNQKSMNEDLNTVTNSQLPKGIAPFSFVSIEHEISQLKKFSSLNQNQEKNENLRQNEADQKRNQMSLKIDTSKVNQYINENGYDYPSKSQSRNYGMDSNGDMEKFTLTEQLNDEQQNENKDSNKIRKVPRTQQNSPTTYKSKTPLIENSKSKMIEKPVLRNSKPTYQIDRNSKDNKPQPKHQRTPTQELKKSPSQQNARKMSDDTLIKKTHQRDAPNRTPSFTDRVQNNNKPRNAIEFTQKQPRLIQQRKSNFDVKPEEKKSSKVEPIIPFLQKRQSEIKSKQDQKRAQQSKPIQRQRGESHEKYLERALAIKNSSPQKQPPQSTKSIKKPEASSYFNSVKQDFINQITKQEVPANNIDNTDEEIRAEMSQFQAVDELSYEHLMKQQKQNEELLEMASCQSDRSTPRKSRKFNIEPDAVEDNLAPIPQHFLKRNKQPRIQNQSEKGKYYQPVKKVQRMRYIEICQLDEELVDENGEKDEMKVYKFE